MNKINLSACKQFFSGFSMQWGSLIILTITAALVYNHFFLSRAYVEFDLDVDQKTTLEMYWAGEGEQYSGFRMARVRLQPGESHYGFSLDDLREIRHLRLDPIKNHHKMTITIRKITISQPGMVDMVFVSEADFNRYTVGHDIFKQSFVADKGWTIVSNGGNPHFNLEVDPGERSFNILIELVRFLTLLGLFWLAFRACTPLIRDYNYVSLLAFGILVMMMMMATTSWDNHHPDEWIHINAAAYYQEHWLMPAVESPEIADTYSGYGFSRLNSKEISYFLTGKFASLLDHFHLPSYQRYRFFNVLLFSILALLTLQSLTARLLFIPLLMTPQVWYIFSYYNSDAFALFTAMITAHQLTWKKSLFHRTIAGEAKIWQAMLLLGPLVAALLLTKKNFYFYLIFIFIYLMISFGFKRFQASKPVFKKLFLLACVGLALVGVRYAVDVSVNGFDKGKKIQEVREQMAYKAYKSSTNLNEQHPNLYLKERGVSFKQLFNQYHWGGKVVKSFYGVYCYMSVAGSTAYYDLMRNTGFLFLAFIIMSIIFRGGWWENTLLVNALVCCCALIAVACYRAWNVDFQPQGRYMMVILPILGILIVHTERLFQPVILRSFIVFMFVMSAYNFLFVGLLGIAKYGWG